MQIKGVEEVTCTFHYVETDEKPWNQYRRWSADCWELLMGESWESWYDEKIEEEFQRGLVG